MAFSQQFFDFQLTFADRLVARFPPTLPDALYHYTTFSNSLGMDDWDAYLAGLAHACNPGAWTYQWYLARRLPDPAPTMPSITIVRCSAVSRMWCAMTRSSIRILSRTTR
jgi:hypothetical protein